MTEPEALELIESTFVEIDRWKIRVASQLEPAPGSELAADDLDWPYFRLSETARSGLASAVDHLDAVRLTIVDRRLFSFAQLTLIRSTIVGASQAVWVLAPDDRARRVERARTAAVEWYSQQRVHTRALMALPGAGKAVGQLVLAQDLQRLDELRAKRDADGQRAKYEATSMIRAAALAIAGDKRHADEAEAEWRRLSGLAHGLSWAVLGGRGATPGAADSSGVAWFPIAGDLTAAVNPYMLAVNLTRLGWSLLLRRALVR